MKVYKDNQHCVTLHPFSWRGKRYLMVCVGLYAGLDPEGGVSRVRTEQEFWKEVPGVFAALAQAPVVDICLPKPGGEVLVAGFCRAPGKALVPAQEVAFRVGDVHRRIAVFGDRERLPGGGCGDPLPFSAMPLIWERAFGGPNFPANPAGLGLDADNRPLQTLPNLEDPDQLLLSRDDRPRPVCPFPLDIANPERRALSGTYDQHWIDTRWPAYPDDCDPAFFYSAQPAQRLHTNSGATPFFRGDEPVEIIGMHHEFPHIRSRLPRARQRAFVKTTEAFTPFAPLTPGGKNGAKPRLPYLKDLDGPGLFREVELHCDTVWLFPDLLGAFVLHRGLIPVADDELDDVLRVLVVTEDPSDAPKSLEYYHEELKKRAHPSVEIDLAPFAAAQARISKAVKMARDVPKLLAKIKRDALGQSPVMPLSLGDMAHSAQKTIATGRATLDQLEKQMLAQREQFSHLMSFDLSVFPRMRAMLDAQEQNLNQTLRKADAELRRMDEQIKKGTAPMQARVDALLRVPPDAGPREIVEKKALAERLDSELAKLDNLTPEGVLCSTPPLNPWHDRGFPLVIAARRALRRNDHALSRLAEMGLESRTIERIWLGHAPKALTDKAENWGLPPDPAAPEFTLPAGLYVPRFAGKALSALRVYPWPDQDPGSPRGLGADAGSILLVPGSDETPLSLPAAHPGGAVIAAPEDLSALFTEQECGDFCHIAAAAHPKALAAVEDLPPLLPEAPKENGGLPLLVILPPLPQGKSLFAPWREAFPAAIPLYLPAGCPHVVALTEKGHRLRRLVLDALPPELAKPHDFDFPLPPRDRPPEPFTLNLPLPTREELQGHINALIQEVRSHFPDPQTMLEETLAKCKPAILARLKSMNLPPEAFARARAALDAPAPPSAGPSTVAEITARSLAGLADMKKRLPPTAPPAVKAKFLAALEEAEKKTRFLGETLAPLDALREDGLARLEAFKKGDLPEDIKAAFAKKGMDPNALKPLSREEVKAVLAGNKNLERRNLQGLDLSGLDFSGANLAHALCGKANFQNCRMDRADFTFTLAHEADFTGATFREAAFKQTVLQKARLRQADFSASRMELTTLGECDCAEALFDGADLKLCTFAKATLDGARFGKALLSLCSFSEMTAAGADFSGIRAFKCLFQKADLQGANFREAALNECLFQMTTAVGVSLAGAELRKFYTDADTDLSGADFSGADLREASLRMSRFCGADFYNANLENALIAQCDLSRARLDGLRAAGCCFIKCDLTEADLSGTTLMNGALRKCRLNAADLTGTNLYAANLYGLIVNPDTQCNGMNVKRTALAGKEEALRDAARRNS